MNQEPLAEFRLLGFDIQVQHTFLLILGVYFLFQLQGGSGLVSMISWPIVVFVSIVVHEIGHTIACRRFKVKTGPITLHGMGGFVMHYPTTAKRQLVISLAGPFMGLALGGVVLVFQAVLPMLLEQLPSVELATTLYIMSSTVIGQMLFVNILWSLVNLLPIGPLDGAHALQAGLTLILPERKAAYSSAVIGFAIAAVSAMWLYTVGEIFIAMLCAFFSYQSFQRMQALS